MVRIDFIATLPFFGGARPDNKRSTMPPSRLPPGPMWHNAQAVVSGGMHLAE
jgi:hypothetical protein